MRKVRWIGRDLSGSELNQSRPSEGAAPAVVANAQLRPCGAEMAAGTGGGMAPPLQRWQRGRRRGAAGANPTSIGARAFFVHSVDVVVVRELTWGPHAAMVYDGANGTPTKKVMSPQSRESSSRLEFTSGDTSVAR
jgi:hypothetical protein